MPIAKFIYSNPVKCKQNKFMPKIITRDVIITTTIGIAGDITLSSATSNEINIAQTIEQC